MGRSLFARVHTCSFVFLLLASATLTAGCGDDSSPAGPGGGGSGGGTGPLSARIDGVAWSAAEATVSAIASVEPGQLGFLGASVSAPSIGMSLTLGSIPGPGTYPLGVNVFTNAGGTGVVTVGGVSALTPLDGASGSVTIATLTSTRVTGTFSFVAIPSGGGTSIEVTAGNFDVPLSAGFVPVTGDARGSRTVASLGGVEWNAATVVGVGSSGTYSFTASNTEYTLSCVVGPIDAPDSGPLSLSTPVRRLSVTRNDGTAAWGASANDTGTLAILTLSGTRITGAFSGSLTASVINDVDDPLEISGGSFEVRLTN